MVFGTFNNPCFSYNEETEDLQVEPDIFEDYEAEEEEEAEQGFSQRNSGKFENHLNDNKNSESNEIVPQVQLNEGNNSAADKIKLFTPVLGLFMIYEKSFLTFSDPSPS